MKNLFEAYRLLGIPADSSLTKVTKAYRTLAKKYHPDSNPENDLYSQEIMMKINEAYKTIKENQGNVRYKTDFIKRGTAHKIHDKISKAWLEQYEIEKKKEKAKQKQKKESEALQKFLEKVIIERKHEIEDKKTYDVITEYAYHLISYFYEKNFHNILMIKRPYIEKDFDEYINRFKNYMKKIRTLEKSNRSRRYRKKSVYVYEFLKSFILDAVKSYPIGIERRASAVDIFQHTACNLHKFIGHYFSAFNIKKEEDIIRFKKTLSLYENFLKSYSDSPLTQYAKKKIEVLEKFYLAFLKEI